jgi:Family of unknown function (DUF6325)
VGPLEVVAIEFPGSRVKGHVMLALASAVERGAIRIVDVTFLCKDASGALTSYELAELDEADSVPFDLVDATMGLLSVDDLDKIGAMLAPDTSAALIVFEYAWEARFEAAVRCASGRVVARQRIRPRSTEATIRRVP